jgi:hypothetical protein
MTDHVMRLIEETGEASGLALHKALNAQHVDDLAHGIKAAARLQMLEDPETWHLAAHLNLREDGELFGDAAEVYEITYRTLQDRLDRFVKHLTAQSLKQQRRLATLSTKEALESLLSEDMDDFKGIDF